MMQFSVYQQSHVGGRRINQDRMGYCFTRDALLLVLADGMGGHMNGELAATIAMQTLSTMFQMAARPHIRKPGRFLEEAMIQAHRDILAYTARHKLPESPRTTVVACLVQHNCAVWAHCGDSRLYWLRGNQVLAQTRDHSQLEVMIERGLASEADRASHPDRNKLYNCVGSNSAPRIEVSPQVILAPGDVLMLCSDGLWSMVSEAEIVQKLATRSVVQAVPELVDQAVAIGGERADNTTALAISWQGEDPADAKPGVVTTGLLPADQISSTIGNVSAATLDSDLFDEDEIEKAIAEINQAIEKSSQLLK
jgi:PPM family protein phosphatase